MPVMKFVQPVNGEPRIAWYWSLLLSLIIYVVLSVASVLFAIWWTGDIRAGGPALGIGFAVSFFVWWRGLVVILHGSGKS